MSQELSITYALSTSPLLPKEIRDMLYVDTDGEAEISLPDRTLTAIPLDESRRAQTKKKRIAGLNRGMISMSEDFNAPLPDEFWLGQE
jgi:hypothetical protein